ncbi:hypothetical protein FM109_09865 [Vibrio casei]|nr:hypothetical protein FM109_09865 [Vibrio casei]
MMTLGVLAFFGNLPKWSVITPLLALQFSASTFLFGRHILAISVEILVSR